MYLFHDVRHVAYISGNEQGRPHYTPHTELGAVLCVRLTGTVLQWSIVTAPLTSGIDEVGIIPSTWT